MGHGRTGRLATGFPFTIDPGVYLPAKGGVRIEDTIVVRADVSRADGGRAGRAEILTTTAKELLVL
jgi:Xaa-Pro aminopeptidase